MGDGLDPNRNLTLFFDGSQKTNRSHFFRDWKHGEKLDKCLVENGTAASQCRKNGDYSTQFCGDSKQATIRIPINQPLQ